MKSRVGLARRDEPAEATYKSRPRQSWRRRIPFRLEAEGSIVSIDSMRSRWLVRIVSLWLGLGAGAAAAAPRCEQCAEWNRPREPFRVFGNTYYVGVAGLASVLIVSDKGLILLD